MPFHPEKVDPFELTDKDIEARQEFLKKIQRDKNLQPTGETLDLPFKESLPRRDWQDLDEEGPDKKPN